MSLRLIMHVTLYVDLYFAFSHLILMYSVYTTKDSKTAVDPIYFGMSSTASNPKVVVL